MRAPIPTEHQSQVAVIQWFRAQHPRTLIAAVPNGAHLAGTAGQRAAKVAKLKAEGMLPGFPDLIIPAWRVAVEMKRERGRNPEPEQIAVHEALRDAGWLVIVAKGAGEAIARLGDVARGIAA